jgi:hypothetical protein
MAGYGTFRTWRIPPSESDVPSKADIQTGLVQLVLFLQSSC